MIGDWIAAWPTLIAALATIFLPGLALGFALRLRGLMLWALAPVGSTAAFALLAILFGFTGIVWSPLSAAMGCLALAVVVWLCAIPLRREPAAESIRSGLSGLLAAGLALGVVLGALRFGFYVGAPAAISQTNDAVYHLNTLRYIAETGSASSFDLTGMLGSTAFYPGAWHAITSVVSLATGGDIPTAVNMVSLVIAAVIWPLGVAWLTRVATGSIATAALAAALSPALLVFPMLMLEWGVLYPYALAVAMLPASVAIVVSIPAWRSDGGPAAQRGSTIIVATAIVLAALAALALSQPSVILAWMIAVAIWFTFWIVRRAREPQGMRRRTAALWLTGAWAAFAVLWVALTATTPTYWGQFQGRVEAIRDVLLNSPVLLPAAAGVSILMLVGLVVAVRQASLRWLAVVWIALAGLYIVSSSIGNPFLRRWLLAAWYADPYRLAALMPVVVIPLAAIGLAAIVGWAAGALKGTRPRAVGVRSGAWALAGISAVALVALVVAPVVQMPKAGEGEKDTQTRYSSNRHAFLSPDERALLESLDSVVAEDARVIGNPSTGTGFGFMFSGRDVYPKTWAPPLTEDWGVLAQSLRYAAHDADVCTALTAYGDPEYVLDFGPGETTPGRYLAPGMTGFQGRDGFELVSSEGDASLWRITACR